MINEEKSFVAMCKFLLWLFIALVIFFVGFTGVFADTITDYATRYYYGYANDTSNNATNYRTGSDNRLTLFPGTSPTYANSETLTGFYNRINYSIEKGTKYNLTLKVSMSSLAESEFATVNVNNRLLNIDFARCTSCTFQGVSGSIRKYNASAPVANNLYDYVVTIIYSFIATETTNQFYLGTYTGDDRTLGIYEHQYTSIVMVTDLTIDSDNSSTIINQNDTIINQNNQIMEQNEQNTQEIIDANNQNTQDIINNQNQNNQQQIESQKVCTNFTVDNSLIKEENSYLSSNGSVLSSSSSNGITDYIKINSDTDLIVLKRKQGTDNTTSYCFYNKNKELISCTLNNTLVLNENINIPNNSEYVRFTLNNSSNTPQFSIYYCQNGNQALNDSITDLNDSLNDDDSSGATSEASSFFSNFNTNTFGLTSIITAPLNLIQSLTSSTCSELHLPLPYLNNKYLDLPCMTSIYQTHFGSFFTMYQTITYGIIAYWVIVRIFNQVKDFKNPEHDEIEVVDL